MPRSARLDIPDLLQHAIMRGVNRCDIFADNLDRHKFLQRFSLLLAETQTACLAWALMPNHIHLLLRPGPSGLAHFMRRLLTGYAIHFNRRHKRSGHLFQNRYKSLVCEEEPYLLELVRYIHLNPLRAGLVKDLNELDQYPWSGHTVLAGQVQLVGQMTDDVLGLFARHRGEAFRLYREFLTDGLEMGQRDDLVGQRSASDTQSHTGAGDNRILGNDDFVQRLAAHNHMRNNMPLPIAVDEVVARVCRAYEIAPADLLKNTRTSHISTARSLVCFLSVHELRHSGVVVGEYVGLGRAGVSRAAIRGRALVENNPRLLDLVNK